MSHLVEEDMCRIAGYHQKIRPGGFESAGSITQGPPVDIRSLAAPQETLLPVEQEASARDKNSGPNRQPTTSEESKDVEVEQGRCLRSHPADYAWGSRDWLHIGLAMRWPFKPERQRLVSLWLA